MSITFRLTREKEPAQREEFTFDDDLITVGREDENVWKLTSTLVSKRHAAITLREGSYWIEDLKSTNGTFINNEKLVAGNPRKLRSGDRIRIGDYLLEAIFAAPALRRASSEKRPGPVEQKIEPASAQVPLPVPVREEVVEPDAVKAEPPRKAIEPDAPARRIQQLDHELARLKEENRRLTEALARVSQDVPDPGPAGQVGESPSSRAGEALKIFLRTFSRLARGRASFFHEFMGTTFVGGGRSSFLEHVEDSGIQFLLHGPQTGGSSSDRLGVLSGELDAIALHTIALLDGYRKSIDEGTRKILQRLSPDAINEDLKNTSLRLGRVEIPYRYLPVIRELKVRQIVRRRVEELLREDRGVLERRFFRDGFTDGYQACLVSAKGSPRRDGKVQDRSENP